MDNNVVTPVRPSHYNSSTQIKMLDFYFQVYLLAMIIVSAAWEWQKTGWQWVQVRGIVSYAFGIKIAMPNQSFFSPASHFQLFIECCIYLSKHSSYCIFFNIPAYHLFVFLFCMHILLLLIRMPRICFFFCLV